MTVYLQGTNRHIQILHMYTQYCSGWVSAVRGWLRGEWDFRRNARFSPFESWVFNKLQVKKYVRLNLHSCGRACCETVQELLEILQSKRFFLGGEGGGGGGGKEGGSSLICTDQTS